MRLICDLHLHSRFSQGCSKNTTVKLLAKWAKIKGIDILGTGDFTHPEWIKELKAELTKEKDGIYYTADGQAFVLSTEISLIYTQDGRGRRIHVVLLAPSFAVVDQITAYFLTHGRVDYDGRPIFKLSASRLVKDLRNISEEIEVIPAHAWTPWFSLFGSRSGFDSLQECFGDQTTHIHAIETGLSSDIEMNDRLDQLNNIRFVSFSDSHSYWPWRLGREATIFELEKPSYAGIVGAIRTGKGFWGTIEVEPSYGKYHVDGHRACDVRLEPSETRRLGGICPVCKRPLTIGVLYRVEQLADRPEKAEGHSQRFLKLLPLHEILSIVLGKGMTTKTVWDAYWKLLAVGKNEYDILIDVPRERLLEAADGRVVDAILAVREGKVTFTPGYDGVYGIPSFPGIATRMTTTASDIREERNEGQGKGKSYMAKHATKKSKEKPRGQKGLGEFFG